MSKKFMKELIIVLLLCLAIILVLGIMLYEYVPTTKAIPNAVAYKTPQDVRQELAEAGELDESNVIMTYEVDSTELSNYTDIQKYKPGKANPFSSFEATGTATNSKSSTSENGAANASTAGGGGSTASSGVSNSGVSTSNTDNNGVGTTGNSNSGGQSSGVANSGTTLDGQTTTSGGGQFFQDKGTK